MLFSGALAACHYISNKREKIFNVLYKALNSNSTELQEVAHDCMKKVHVRINPKPTQSKDHLLITNHCIVVLM